MTGPATRPREEGTQAPPATAVPRRALDERERRELEAGLQRVKEEIRQLQDFSGRIPVPADIRAEIDRTRQRLRNMRLSDVPFLGQQYQNELDMIGGTLDQARRASEERRSVDASRLLERAHAQMRMLGDIFELEMGMLIVGLPPGVTEQKFMDLLNSVEAALIDIGTSNQQRGNNIIAATRLYVDNIQFYNIDDPAIRRERDALFEFIITGGLTAGLDSETRTGNAYTPRHATEDRSRLHSFEENIASIRTQVRQGYILQLGEWRQDIIARIAAMAAQDETRRQFERLRDDIDALLVRLQNNDRWRGVREEEVRDIETTYRLVTGRAPRLNSDQQYERTAESAINLRGTAPTVTPGTPEWFGQQAIDALREGNREIAAVAVSMGLLVRAAQGAPQNVRTYISADRYQEIIDIITFRRQITPAMRSRLANDMDVAGMYAEMDRLTRENPVRGSGTARQRAERTNSAVRVARERMRQGDVEGARRLLEMDTQYAYLLQQNRGRQFTGLPEMEASIDAEIRGENATQRFGNASKSYLFSQRVAGVREGISDWGRGITTQKELADQALARVETLVGQGNFTEAQRVLTFLMMYTDSVERLGVRRSGRIESLNPQYDGNGMERALNAFIRGQAQVDGTDRETVFIRSFNTSQRAAAELEATRLEGLTRNRPEGRERVLEAIQAARQRAASGDIRGAFLLLHYVAQYYGVASEAQRAQGSLPMIPARSEGWRYTLLARQGEGYRQGRELMLDAIRMEIYAESEGSHNAAERTFESGTIRIADSAALTEDFQHVRNGFAGREPIVPGHTDFTGQADTLGRVPIGDLPDGRTLYVDLEPVRQYERAHPQDAVLFPPGRRVETLEQLLTRCEAMVRAGDLSGYNRLKVQLYQRLEVVSRRAARAQDIGTIRRQLVEMEGSLGSLPVYWNITGDDERETRIRELRRQAEHGDITPEQYRDRVQAIQGERQTVITGGAWRNASRGALDTRRQALLRRLDSMENSNEDLVPQITREGSPLSLVDEYSGIMRDFDRERRISVGAMRINDEVKVNEDYERNIRAARSITGFGTITGGNEIVSRTLALLGECRTLLGQSREQLTAGNTDRAIALYQQAMQKRAEAMLEYDAENAMNLSNVAGAHRRHTGPGLAGLDPRFGAGRILWLQQRWRENDFYVGMHVDVFRTLVSGTPPANEREARAQSRRMEMELNGAMLMETSIFSVPVHSGYQFIGVFNTPQRHVRGYVLAAMQSMAEGDMERADRHMRGARDQLEEIQIQAQRNQLTTTVFLTSIALVSMAIPHVGIYLGTALFLGMWADHAYTEYQRDGQISWSTWGELALILVPLGVAAAASRMARLAIAARAIQSMDRFARFARYARTLTYTNYALMGGMTAYMGYQAYRTFSMAANETDPRRRSLLMDQGVFTAGMAIFPWVHMGMTRLYEGPARPVWAELSGSLDNVVPERAPTLEVVEPEGLRFARELRNPSRLFEFLRELRSTDAAVRAGAEAKLRLLPPDFAAGVSELSTGRLGGASYLRLPGALESGELTPPVRAELEGAIGRLGPEARPEARPNVTIPTRAQTDTAGLVADSEALPSLLRDLLIPDEATGAQAVARDAARANLARIRGENPRVAGLIDRLLSNPDYAYFRSYLRGETLSPDGVARAQRTLSNTQVQIRAEVPEAVVGEAMRAAVGYRGGLQGEGAQPVVVQGEGGTLTGEGVPPVRAMAGDQGGGRVPPDTTTPGRVVTNEGGEGGGRGGPRGPTGPGERPPPQEVVQIGRFERFTRWASGKFRQWRADRAVARQRPDTPEAMRSQFSQDGAEAVRDTLEVLRNPQRVQEELATRRGVADAAEARVEQLRRGGARPEQVRAAELDAAQARADAVALESNIRSAPDRLASLLKAAYARARALRGKPEGAAYWRLVRRLYANYETSPVARERLTRMAETDPLLNEALTQGRRNAVTDAGRRDLTTHLNSIRDIPANEWSTLVKAVETQGAEVNTAAQRLRVAESELAQGRGSQREVTAARRDLERLLNDRGIPMELAPRELVDAAQRLRAAETELAAGRGTQQQVDTARAEYLRLLNERGIRTPIDPARVVQDYPLAKLISDHQLGAPTELATGIQLTPIDRAAIVLDLEGATVRIGKQDVPLVAPDRVILERDAFIGNARAGIEGVEARGRINEAIRDGLAARVERGGSLDTALADVLTSDDVIAAVRREYGDSVATAYERAVKGDAFQSAVKRGNLYGRDSAVEILDRAMASLSTEIAGVRGPPQLAEGIMRYGRALRETPQLADSFAAIDYLGSRADLRLSESSDAANARLIANREFGLIERVRNAYRRVREEGVLGTLGRGARATGRGLLWMADPGRFGRAVRESLVDPETGAVSGEFWRSGLRAAGRNWWRAAITAGSWAAYAYTTHRIYSYIRAGVADNVDQGIRNARLRYGQSVTPTPENARWILTPGGGEFFNHQEARLPRGPEGQPQSERELKVLLDRPGEIVNPERFNEWLNDGRAMEGRLSEINRLLAQIRAGGEGATAARTTLEGILSPMGITGEAVQQLLTSERKTQLDITDMYDLRVIDWVNRGILLRYRDVEALDFCRICGISEPQLTRYAQFLANNTDVFVILWRYVDNGNLPMTFLDDAIAALSTATTVEGRRETVLDGLKRQVTQARALDAVIQSSLSTANLYFETPIAFNSFLGALDRRAVIEPGFRQSFEGVLRTYRTNASAIQRFNEFSIRDDEGIYGDISQLATRIAAATDAAGVQTVLTEARQQGRVLPAVLVRIDPSLAGPESTELVKFVLDHSDIPGGRGLLRWITDDIDQRTGRPRHITNLRAILSYLVQNSRITTTDRTQTPPTVTTLLRPDEIYSPAAQDRSYIVQLQTEFTRRGWGTWPPPRPAAPSQQGQRQEAPGPTGQRYGRIRRGDDIRGATPTRQDQAATPINMTQIRGAMPPPLVTLLDTTIADDTLSPTARTFYGNAQRAGRLDATLQALFYDLHEDRSADGRIFREAYGRSRARVEEAVKAELFRLLSDPARRQELQTTYGITVTGEGDALTVTQIDVAKTAALRGYIVQFLTNKSTIMPRTGVQEALTAHNNDWQALRDDVYRSIYDRASRYSDRDRGLLQRAGITVQRDANGTVTSITFNDTPTARAGLQTLVNEIISTRPSPTR